MLKAGFDVKVAQKKYLSNPAASFNTKHVAVVKQTGLFPVCSSAQVIQLTDIFMFCLI